MNKKPIAYIVIAVIIALGTASYFVIKGTLKKDVPSLETRENQSLGAEIYSGVQNPGEKLPETNPFEKETNPLKGVYTNPFE